MKGEKVLFFIRKYFIYRKKDKSNIEGGGRIKKNMY